MEAATSIYHDSNQERDEYSELSCSIHQITKPRRLCPVYVYVYVSYFCIKRGDPQIRIQAKQERRTSEYRKKGGGVPHNTATALFFLLPLDANAITWYRFRQKHHSNHHITCQQTVPTTLLKQSYKFTRSRFIVHIRLWCVYDKLLLGLSAYMAPWTHLCKSPL